MYKKMCFLFTFFVLTIIAWTNYRLVTKHVISITHFHTYSSFLFLLFHENTIYTKKKRSNKDYLLLIYTFMGMIQFWRSVQLSFKSHKMCTFSPGLGMARNRDGLSWNDFFKYIFKAIETKGYSYKIWSTFNVGTVTRKLEDVFLSSICLRPRHNSARITTIACIYFNDAYRDSVCATLFLYFDLNLFEVNQQSTKLHVFNNK